MRLKVIGITYMNKLIILLLCFSVAEGVELDALYINKKDVSDGIEKLKRWIRINERNETDKDKLISIGIISGTLYSLEIAKGKVDDIALDKATRIEFCRLCHNLSVIIAKRMPVTIENGKVAEDENLHLLDWVGDFNGGAVVF